MIDYSKQVFPKQPYSGYDNPYQEAGMTLLEYFAAKAMQGVVTGHFSHYGHDAYGGRSVISEEAYDIAKAMLEERKKYVQS